MTDRALYALILAGGSGTRLWPYSRRERPKQLLPLVGHQSMLQETVGRLAPLIPPERVVVLTGAGHVTAVRDQLPAVPPMQVVAEPAPLGTAAAVGLGAALLAAWAPGAVMAVLPADHIIEPAAAFLGNLVQAADTADDGWLVTFGIPPTSPETGFGYLELGAPLPGPAGAYRVARFVEKPDEATAVEYLAGGRHLWNSGMFVWRVDAIQAEFAAHLPELAARLGELQTLAAAGPAALDAGLGEVWGRITDRTTIDYGIMERSARAACVPAAFEWSDVGSWSALAAVLETRSADVDGNVCIGERTMVHDTRRSLVFARGDRLVATVGVDDLVIIDTADAVLVCRRDKTQDVRQIVARLEADAAHEQL